MNRIEIGIEIHIIEYVPNVRKRMTYDIENCNYLNFLPEFV